MNNITPAPQPSTPTPLDIARAYHQSGYAPIPLCSPTTPHKHGPLECTSPGKVPLAPKWQVYAQSQTPQDVYTLFISHKGNVGLAVKPGHIVIDIDPRNGGNESWAALQSEFGDFIDDTPQVYTGGDGQHYYFKLPEGVEVKGGGSLTEYPGVEWKSAGGQVVAPPSIHASGNPYFWEADSAPNELETKVIRPWLLKIIENNTGKVVPFAAPDANAPNLHAHDAFMPPRPQVGKGYTPTQRRALIAGSYGEGERHSKASSVIGMLISRAVCEVCAVAFMGQWDDFHCSPPQGQEAVTYQIANMYRLYGGQQELSRCRHDGHPFIKEALAASNLKIVDSDTGEIISGPDAGKIIDLADVRSANAAKEAREAFRRSYANIVKLINNFAIEQNADFRTIETPSTKVGIFAGVDLSTGQPGTFFDPGLHTPLEDLKVLTRLALGEDNALAMRIDNCAKAKLDICDTDGPMKVSPMLCRAPLHALCANRMAHKVSRLTLTDLDGGGSAGRYRKVVIERPVIAYAPTLAAQGEIFQRAIKDNTRAVTALSHTKDFTSKVLARSTHFYLDRPQSKVYLSVWFLDDGDDDELMDEAIAYLTKKLQSGARVAAEQSYYAGRHVIEQMMYDAMSSFVGIADLDDWMLFAAYATAVKGKHLFQGMSVLYTELAIVEAAMKEEKAEKPKCPICDAVMRSELRPPGFTLEDAKAEAAAANPFRPMQSAFSTGPPGQAYSSKH